MSNNCSDPIPRSLFYLHNLMIRDLVMVICASVFFLVTLVVSLMGIWRINKRWSGHNGRAERYWLMCLPLVIGATALLGVYVPRASYLVDLIASVYLSICLVQFFHVVISLHGSRAKLREKFKDKLISLRIPPICCCFCLPQVLLSRKVARRLAMAVLQTALLRPVITTLSMVIYLDRDSMENISLKSTSLYLGILTGVSTLSAVYALGLLFQCSKDTLPINTRITVKFIVIKIALLLCNIQDILFSALQAAKVIPCYGILSSKVRGQLINHVTLTLEVIPLSVLALYSYSETPQNIELQENVNIHGNTYDKETTTENGTKETERGFDGPLQANGDGPGPWL